jgi:hypothetical protein
VCNQEKQTPPVFKQHQGKTAWASQTLVSPINDHQSGQSSHNKGSSHKDLEPSQAAQTALKWVIPSSSMTVLPM